MKKFVLPNDYPDMPASLMHVYLVEAGHDCLPECRRIPIRVMREKIPSVKWE